MIYRRIALLFLINLLSAPCLALDRVDAYIARLDARVNELLARYQVPSAAVAVIHNGQTYSRSWGTADLMTGRMPADDTLYNVASISKLVTAWGVMRLVQEGRVSLDAPISRYVSSWKLPPSDWNNQVTVRRLLSHTAGLSMPAVPQYGPDQPVPTLAQMLSDSQDPVRVIEKPGSSYRYSGGGFGVLQLLIEEVTRQPYERYIEAAVLKPLGMTHSTFEAPAARDLGAATPYDKTVRPLPHYRFAADGAAGLYTTIKDLAALAMASLKSRNQNTSLPLKPEVIELMLTPTATEKPDPFGYGLGYSIVPLPGGGEAFGHAGSNDGWTAVLSTVPATGDALVVMLNRSNAFPVYRDLMCEWVDAVKGKKWPGFCDNACVSWTEKDGAFVDNLFSQVSSADPATAVLVATSAGVVYRKSFGSLDLETRTPAAPESPFYLASLTKSLTALVALKLVQEGHWKLSDTIGTYLLDLPAYIKNVTIEQLLSHTAGVPDYYGLIDWPRYDGINNAKVISLLSQRSELEFPAGTQYKYSNSGYILIAAAIERLTGLPYRQVLREKVLKPAGMNNTFVFDGSGKAPEKRARGYVKEKGGYVLSDYQVVTIDGVRRPFGATTYGAGGIYSTVDDLYALDQALFRGDILSLPIKFMAKAPRTPMTGEVEVPNAIGHGFGWFISSRYDTNVIWNTGDMLGHKSALLQVPKEQLTIVILSNAGGRQPEEIALEIADHLLAKKQR
jgi:CubicO group peptidase (beta-lactamase class C family)